MQWTSDLYDFEATPPPGSWERINFELDNNISEFDNNSKTSKKNRRQKSGTAVQKELRWRI
jgi:hypothetical protein